MSKSIIVKLRKIEDQINGSQIVITDKTKKSTLKFHYNDLNYSVFNAILGHRLLAFYYATIDGQTLNLAAEAPWQPW